ncbi:Dehydroquinase [Aspergillus pseudotamarii]|uniref:3-dehydroquinate dehydratase n=1 Tax=Aspergillus pseudotamarii TaxID=132259 RepID=A0A5N6TB45_ASPPS|nr:Dehydroquinase [Aspergillus pseudotamarii]KAE8143605.1 Dehydroquinase [Aspergillus pseudotamarii]
MPSHNILLVNGPSLNLLGTLLQHGISASCFQSNSEADIRNRIHQAREDGVADIIIYPAAYTYMSVAIYDALFGVGILLREIFGHHSYLTGKASAVICGMGVYGYFAALDWWV